MEGKFEVVFHHQGRFTGLTNLDYYGCENVWSVDEDLWSYFAIIGKVKEMGYPMIEALWYYDPNIDGEIARLRDDTGIRRMKNIAENYDRIHLYVTHPVCKPEIVALDPLIEYPIMAQHAKYTSPFIDENEMEAGLFVVGSTSGKEKEYEGTFVGSTKGKEKEHGPYGVGPT